MIEWNSPALAEAPASLKVIIIDDEVHARNILAHYLGQLQGFELVSEYDNCMSCFEANDLDEVDLLLLDINLPVVSGLQFSRTIARYKTEVIFTTAYSEYALDGYEHKVIDYLLKPIEMSRFAKAMEKARQHITLRKEHEKRLLTPVEPVSVAIPKIHQNPFIFVKADYKIIKVLLADITFIEGLQEYIRIHLVKGKPIVTLQSLKNLTEMLPNDQFIRVHRSYIINIQHMDYVQQRSVLIDGKELKIGKNYWDGLMDYLNRHGLF